MTTLTTTIILASAVSGILANPTQLNARQAELTVPPNCDKLLEDIRSDSPTLPTIIDEFASSFYETVSRTATGTDQECAWITSMPDPVRDEYLDYLDALMDKINDPETREKSRNLPEECRTTDDGSRFVCQAEAQVFRDQAMEDGWNPKPYQSDPVSDEDSAAPSAGVQNDPPAEEVSAAAGVGVQAWVGITLLASFVGTVALL